MMGRVGGTNAALPLSLMEVFEKACPYYIKLGMTYDQFWDGDVSAHRAYREAEKLRLREVNQTLWLQGMYVYEAIGNLAPYIKAFSKARPKPYPDRPYDIFEDDRKRRLEEEARERYEHIREKVEAFAKAFNEKRKEREVDDNAGCVP